MRWWRRIIDRITGADRRRAAYQRAIEAERGAQAAGRQSIINLAHESRWRR